MKSTFEVVNNIIELTHAHGLRKVVISPGSRNAPLTIAFDNDERFTTYNIPDERSAAFVAMGMAQALSEPVAVVCTSGSAVLNYGPAVAEAFYQRIPLIVLSADRPDEWIDQMDGQTIRQQGSLSNHLRYENQLRDDCGDSDVNWHNQRVIQEAMIRSTGVVPGPVHLNIPFREPLYNRVDGAAEMPRSIRVSRGSRNLSENQLAEIQREWNACDKRLVLVGSLLPDDPLTAVLEQLASTNSTVVLTETTSNVSGDDVINQIDVCIEGVDAQFDPELLVVVGGPVVSKKIKSYLRKASIKACWTFAQEDEVVDTYQHLTRIIEADASAVLKALARDSAVSEFAAKWTHHWEEKKALAERFSADLQWCDYQLFESLSKQVNHLHLHLANSTPIRYSQLYAWHSGVHFYCNRGTSGIDGSTSTALGHALCTDELVLMVTGDISFFYDSNALFNNHLPANLRILLINNSGGNIFKFIPGPATTGTTERHFTSAHERSAAGLAQSHNTEYKSVTTRSEFEAELDWLLNKGHEKAVILEAHTPSDYSPEVLKNFFKSIR